MQSSFIGPQVTSDLHASLALILVQENCGASSQVQVRRRKSKPSHKVLEQQMVVRSKAVNKMQQAAKQRAAKAIRAAKKGKEAIDACEGYEVSNALLICTHQTSDAFWTTMDWVAASQVMVPVRRGTGATGVPGQLLQK